MLDRSTRCSWLGAAALAAIAVANGVGPAPAEEAKLVSPGAAADSYLGYSVAISGSTVVAGAHGTDGWRGAGHVFTRTGADWARQTMLENWGGRAYDQLGYSVAVSGDTALLGVRGANDSAGEAWVYTRSGTNWTRQATLTGTDTVINNTFGYSVALAGDTAVVGALYTDGWRGAVYVFTRTGTTWTQEAKQVAENAAGNDLLGLSVAISGDTIVSGAYGVDAYRGAVYVFRKAGSAWTQEAKISAADGADGDTFGRSVSIDGDVLAVGTEARNARRGAVYLFRRNGTDWTQDVELALPGAAEFDYFGNSVALAGDTLLAGAPGRYGRGAAYVYGRADGVWSQAHELTPADPAASDTFGVSVAMSGGTMVVGAYGKDSYRGAAYVFAVPRTQSGWCLPAKVTAKVNAKLPERSTLTASGTLDTGSGAPDFSGGATFDVGGFHLDVPQFAPKGRALTYTAEGVTLTVTPSKTGSSRAKFSVKAVGDLAGRVDADGKLSLRFVNGAHDARGAVLLTAGKLGAHCVTSPDLCVLAASAVIRGDGADSVKVRLGFVTDGVVPAAAQDVSLGFAGYDSGVLAAASFVRKGNVWVRTAKGPGLTSVAVDFVKGTITVAGSGLDLGAFADGGNDVTVRGRLGDESAEATIRMSRAGAKLKY